MLKQFELTQIGQVAPEEKEKKLLLDRKNQGIIERLKGSLKVFQKIGMGQVVIDNINSNDAPMSNGVTRLF